MGVSLNANDLQLAQKEKPATFRARVRKAKNYRISNICRARLMARLSER